MERHPSYPLIRNYTAEAILDSLLEAHRLPGLVLQRCYPPTGFTTVRSHLGGLPQLPAHRAWPTGLSQGEVVPMHFLAQIDCAELPRVDPAMPTAGMLFFFAVHDGRAQWDVENPQERVRVLYEPSIVLSVPERKAPKGLRPIQDITTATEPDAKPAWLLARDNGPCVHVRWPLEARRMDTWPDAALLPPHARGLDDDAYTERLIALRAGAAVAATGQMPRVDVTEPWERNFKHSWRLPRRWLLGQREFPQAGVMIDRIARVVGHERCRGQRKLSEFKDVMGWVRCARRVGWDNVPDDETRAEFRNWLLNLATDRCEHGGISRSGLSRAISGGLLMAVNHAAASPRVASLFPETLYRDMEGRHLPFEDTDELHPKGHRRGALARVHQMLGHVSFPRSYPPQVVDDAVCLLRVAADPSIGMNFGVHGQMTFWIARSDLEHLQFDRVAVVAEGGRTAPDEGALRVQDAYGQDDPCPQLERSGDWDEREVFSTRPPFVVEEWLMED